MQLPPRDDELLARLLAAAIEASDATETRDALMRVARAEGERAAQSFDARNHDALMAVLRDAQPTFQIHVFGKGGWAGTVVDDAESNPLYVGQMREFVEMVKTRTSPRPLEEIAATLAVLYASRDALTRGERVPIESLL